jgi:hypothetical protein
MTPRIALSVLLGLASAAAIVATPSCAEIPAITAAVVQDVDCVEAAIDHGVDVYEDIAAMCVPLLVEQVVTIVTAEAAPAPDGGLDKPRAENARKVHHKTAAGK